ncbi:MAG TPA: homoserine O-succinyltransferase [Leucothrix mucor]|nr:homoserine O-succinyltransferase [Leucothrix mucor]
MPLVAHSELPTFTRLKAEGQTILRSGQAVQQDIRELHIGLLNMMPDAAIAATERQFLRLIGESNAIIQFNVHLFTLPELPRSEKAQQHIDAYYETFDDIKKEGLDALIITGANVSQPNLSDEDFWKPLSEVIEWAEKNVPSTLCSCLATHAVMELKYQQKRYHLNNKRWGVYSHQVTQQHPLVKGINTQFNVPHSRFNQIDRQQFETAGLHVLVEAEKASVHIAVSENGIRTVFFQGHPEYDAISLVKEYKREVLLFNAGKRSDYPPFPHQYFDLTTQAVLNEYLDKVTEAKNSGKEAPLFPEALIINRIHNTWHDTAAAIMANWMGLVYKITHHDRKQVLMDGLDVDDPLEWKV